MSWIITGTQKEPPSPYLLDTFPAAAAAYSLRQLRTGNTNVVRVRRDNDDAEQDFTATEVSDGTLAAWVGAGNNGFVRTWYDQSGNGYDMIQANVTAQPSVVSSGALQTLSAKPTLVFDGTNDLMNQPTGANWQSISCVARYSKNLTKFSDFDSIVGGINPSGSNAGIGIIGASSTTALRTGGGSQWGDEFYYNGGVYTPGATVFPSITNKALITFISTDAVTGVSGLQIGRDRNYLERCWGGAISEIIVYPSNQSANRTAVEANINAHYSIY